AAAPAGGVRVLEGEAGTLHGRHVVDGDAVQVLRGERVDEDLEAVLVDNQVVLSGLLLDEQSVAEAAAAAGLNAHPEPALLAGHAFLLHEALDLDGRARSNSDRDCGLLSGAHRYLCVSGGPVPLSRKLSHCLRRFNGARASRTMVQSSLPAATGDAAPTATGLGVSAPSDRNDRAIHRKAASAIANNPMPCPGYPKMIFPVPNNVPYTAMIPASQLPHAPAPPGIDSRPNPSAPEMRAQPGPPGRTRM